MCDIHWFVINNSCPVIIFLACKKNIFIDKPIFLIRIPMIFYQLLSILSRIKPGWLVGVGFNVNKFAIIASLVDSRDPPYVELIDVHKEMRVFYVFKSINV